MRGSLGAHGVRAGMTPVRLSIVVALVLLACRLEAQALPPLPQVYRGACPFECCQLGAWTARESLQVYRQERRADKPIAVLSTGQRFTADSADLYTLDWGIITVSRAMRLMDNLGPEADNDS